MNELPLPLRRATLCGLVLMFSGCQEPFGSAVGRRVLPSVVELPIGSGLIQTVSVTPASSAADGRVLIRSVVVNRGNSAVLFKSRVCGLDFAGTLALSEEPGLSRCGGYSMEGPLAAGDSVAIGDAMMLAVPPGAYTLQVRQSLDPDAWVSVAATVVER